MVRAWVLPIACCRAGRSCRRRQLTSSVPSFCGRSPRKNCPSPPPPCCCPMLPPLLPPDMAICTRLSAGQSEVHNVVGQNVGIATASSHASFPWRYLQRCWRPVESCLKPRHVDVLLIWTLCRLLRCPPIPPDIACRGCTRQQLYAMWTPLPLCVLSAATHLQGFCSIAAIVVGPLMLEFQLPAQPACAGFWRHLRHATALHDISRRTGLSKDSV